MATFEPNFKLGKAIVIDLCKEIYFILQNQ